jgi:CheY-like chemotaxis protein
MRTRDQTLDPLDWYFCPAGTVQTRPSSPFAKVSAIRHSPAPRSPGRQSNRSTLMQPLARKRPVVLIVEDEVLVRISTRETVETAGFEVVEAGNADEAIAILTARDDIHLIFTDIHMPGSMDGLKLAHFVRNRWPPVKIVATSGHARIAEGDLPEGGRFLPKP